MIFCNSITCMCLPITCYAIKYPHIAQHGMLHGCLNHAYIADVFKHRLHTLPQLPVGLKEVKVAVSNALDQIIFDTRMEVVTVGEEL